MASESESLRSNSLRYISQKLLQEGAIDELFPSIKKESLKKDDIDFLLDLFEIIKDSFDLLANNDDTIYEICTITSRENLLVRYNTWMEIQYSFIVVLRYFVEYLIVQPNGFY
ncbi:TPA: hypothetical protein QH450_001763, partial [Providencia alcalifaciens]|nr:hypothetical protein [Providencia alcalifaciens]